LLYILSGQDDFSLEQALEEIKRGIGDKVAVAANTTTLEGRQVTMEQLRAACETLPFLAERRLVIVRGLLDRFEAKNRSRRRRKNASAADQQDEYKAIGAYMAGIPDSTVLVLVEGRIRSTNPLFKALAPKAQVKAFPFLGDVKLKQWIQKRVSDEGGSIYPQAAALLTKLVGSNLWVMASEIDKLILFASGRRIEEEDVRAVASRAEQVSAFTMVDAILEFKAGEAERLLQRLLWGGDAPAYLLVVLTRQVQMVVRAKELAGQRMPRTEIQSRLGLTSEFALRKTLEQAGRYPMERLKQVYSELLEADLSIKTGRYGGELTLNILIAELCRRDKRRQTV
jgi:DNA polymerase-3 subunit delta